MSGKVTLEITGGALSGQKFEYAEKTRIFIGRQGDCGIVLPENTVSRYHCVLEITPPEVKLQDFGSRNGTFINGKKIGQRGLEQSWEEARDEEHETFILHNGDEIGITSLYKIRCKIEAAEACAHCGAPLPEGVSGGETLAEGDERVPVHYNAEGKRICEDCYLAAEQERIENKAALKKAEHLAAAAAKDEEFTRQRLRDIKSKRSVSKNDPPLPSWERECLSVQERCLKDLLEEQRAYTGLAQRYQKAIQDHADAAAIEREMAAQRQRIQDVRTRTDKEIEDAWNKAEQEAKKARDEALALQLAKEKEEADRREADRLAAEFAAQIAAQTVGEAQGRTMPLPADKRKECVECGKLFTPKAPDNNLCPACLSDRAKVLDGILKILIAAPEAEKEKPVGPAILQGYQKIKLLGKGGMGEVWKVQETGTGKYYALKTMLSQLAADSHAMTMFLREASVGEALRHKNVVRTYQSGCANGTFYILMDLCEGGSVDDLMKKRGGKLSFELATWITLQVLTGLDYVHNVDITVAIKKGIFRGTTEKETKGVVHRDFKPGNIFLSDTSERPIALVADLGMAKAFNTAGLSHNTHTGDVMGTPVFMPRQQALNFKYAKPEIDVWAAAASYYNMLTGALPKNFRPGINVWQIIVTEPAVPILKRDPSIPQPVAAVIDRALREEPEIGYKSAAAFRKDLVAALPEPVKRALKEVL